MPDGTVRPRPTRYQPRSSAPHLAPAAGAPAPPAGQTPAALSGQLTRAQLAILRLIADGLTDAQIAVEVGWTRGSVSTEVVRIRARLDATNRSHAVMVGIRRGLIPAPR